MKKKKESQIWRKKERKRRKGREGEKEKERSRRQKKGLRSSKSEVIGTRAMVGQVLRVKTHGRENALRDRYAKRKTEDWIMNSTYKLKLLLK